MKKRILLFTLSAGLIYLGLSSNSTGPALNLNNRTGAVASTNNCGTAGCHGGASASTTATIRVDSVGSVSVTKYVAGMTYTVTVTGSNSSMSHYGFQYAVVSGSGGSQVQAGTCASFPSQVAGHALSGVTFVEHSSTISGASLSKQFTWTAPSTAVSTVTMYLTVNAVNGNTLADAADVSGNTSLVLTRESSTGVSNIANEASFNTFPNPVINMLNLQLNGAGNYLVMVCDLSGKIIASQHIEFSSSIQQVAIDAANWTPGMYILNAQKEGDVRYVRQIIKQ